MAIFYRVDNFAVLIDENTLEFASPVIDIDGKRGSAQIHVNELGEISKDTKERYSHISEDIIWDSDIDKFALTKTKNGLNYLETKR